MAEGQFIVERRAKGQRHKLTAPPKLLASRWSHQKELAEAIGKEITILLNVKLPNDTTLYRGVLLAADQFAIQLAHEDQSIMTYFKHSIVGYVVKSAQ